MRLTAVIITGAAALLVQGQEVYIVGTSDAAQPTSGAAKPNANKPSYYFQPFSYTLTSTVRYAASLPAPTSTPTTIYGPRYSDAVKLLNTSLSTTTYGSWLPGQTAISATDTDDIYGQAAWSSMWLSANMPNYTTTGLYSTTVNPSPVPTEELVAPRREYFLAQDSYEFPDGFFLGVAGSAAQIEGAVALEGRGPSQLEVVMTPDQAQAHTTLENYFLYKQDIERIAAMGVKYYSFSISWSRILSFGRAGSPINKQGLQHYDDLINYVLEKGMVPVATMLHFDTPCALIKTANGSGIEVPDLHFDNMGFWNEHFVESFVNYGKILLAHFADRVPMWVTVNELMINTFNFTGFDNVVHAHAQLYHFYHDDLKATGQMGFKWNANFGLPRNPRNQADVEAANRFNAIQLGTYGNPIALGEQYPDAVLQTLPKAKKLTDEELAYIGDTTDFFGLDPYTATVISPPPGGIDACVRQGPSHPLFPSCVVESQVDVHGWNVGYRAQTYVYATPEYIRSFLFYAWNTFRKPIVVGEVGYAIFAESQRQMSDQRFDSPRSQFYLSYLSEMLKSIHEDGVNILGAFAWSFVDNWELGDFRPQFGMQAVNLTTQQRFYKKSFFDLVDFMASRKGMGY
ncbi:glycosyl hydrolase family 1 protein [Hirsutella rhossiliensis]|uniref:Glycosyl hydrolase family 1 protein n=1 Tax=Hirsutella rhossiliensis TaxID=111463 RepID=A0A9P8MTZ1_9HYPO|nr:glycosyl hydrolase family 1 protein [Hirsutella rhossiliensis]KAH0962048.1 glycosyl hydrolase family 1 protein [Hirsutella rhossiliensis]